MKPLTQLRLKRDLFPQPCAVKLKDQPLLAKKRQESRDHPPPKTGSGDGRKQLQGLPSNVQLDYDG